MYDFKLERGEWFKEGFHKLLSLEWNYFEKTWLRIQFVKNTKQKAHHQKNNRLFIPIHKYKTEFKEFKG